MHPLPPQQMSMTWTAIVVERAADGLVSPRCQKCRCELDIHQPEESHPEQLLGTCPECSAWHLIEVAPDGSEAALVDIPGLDEIRRRLAELRTTAAVTAAGAPQFLHVEANGSRT